MSEPTLFSDKFKNAASVSDLTSRSVLVTDSQGALGKFNPNVMFDGVFIMYHNKGDNVALMVSPSKWTALQNSGEVACGVAIIYGCKVLVVAPTDCGDVGMPFSSASFSIDGANNSTREKALDDWNGKSNTAAIIAASSSSAVTNTASYAAGFCNLYSRANSNGNGLLAGKWWLPSVGEMMAIFANKEKIDYALSFITGATKLSGTFHWTSTVSITGSVWRFDFANGYLGTTNMTGNFIVRPVSVFIN